MLECCRLRVKDVDLARCEITVRDGKSGKDRVTMLPTRLVATLSAHLERVKVQHERDLASGLVSVEMPAALDRKYPRAAFEWGWQWVFPASRFYVDPKSGRRRRHHHTQALYVTGKSKRFPPDVVRRAIRKLEYIDLAARLDDLKVPPSNRLHALERGRAGQHAISVNDQWRICSRFMDGDAYVVEIADYH